jgi:hypothetical protein
VVLLVPLPEMGLDHDLRSITATATGMWPAARHAAGAIVARKVAAAGLGSRIG